MNKIPCVVIIYYDYDTIKKCINFLLKDNDKLDIIVLENHSINTENQIKPYILDLLNKGAICKYALFEENISNNAIEKFFRSGILDLSKNSFLILTDGDVVVDNGDWLSEELHILNNNPDVFVCAVTLKTDNLPIKSFPQSIKWYRPAGKTYGDYEEVPTGAQLLFIRSEGFDGFLQYIKQNNIKIRDMTIRDYCYRVLGKKWVRTKNNKAIHLTWDLYQDLDNPYTKLKLSKTLSEHWNHNLYCPFYLFTKEGDMVYYP